VGRLQSVTTAVYIQYLPVYLTLPPFSDKNWVISESVFPIAMSSGVPSYSPFPIGLISALLLMRHCTTSRCPLLTAIWRGVQSSSPLALMSAFWDMRNCTTGIWPLFDAKWSGVIFLSHRA